MNKRPTPTELPNGWALISIGDAGEVRLGRHRSPDKRTGRLATKYLRAANIGPSELRLDDVLEMDFTAEERARYRLQKGDVVLAEASGSSAKVGRAALWNDEIDECCYQNTVIRFRPHVTEPRYALLVFRHLAASGVFARTARGLGIQHLGSRRFASLDFWLPPAEEQIRIVQEATRRLAELADAEAALRSATARVQEQEREIYAAATLGRLVDLGAPSRSGANPIEATDNVLHLERPAPRIAGDRTTHGLTLDALPALPQGWSWSPVGAQGSVQVGIARSPKRETGEHSTKYLRSANVGKEGLKLDTLAEMHLSAAERERFDLRPGDVLVAEASGSPNQVGRSVIWRGEIDKCSYQNHLLRFRSDGMNPEYIDLVFKHYRCSGVFADQSRGVGIQHLGLKRFSSIPVPVPPRADQRWLAKEALRRLALSREQEAAISASLSRLSAMEFEVLAAAATGSLVPQREGVESATDLLARVGPYPKRRRSRKRATRAAMLQREHASQQDLKRTLLSLPDVLRDAGRPLRLPDMFVLAGYDRNEPADVEAFYVALRRELGHSVRVMDDASENGFLELV